MKKVFAHSAPFKDDDLFLGWNTPSVKRMGFAHALSHSCEETPISYSGDGHLLTVAPTRSGKGRGVLVPNLLNYSGPAIVFDPKGELYQVTARYRRSLGQRVIRLDPFGLLGPSEDTLNPFDIFKLNGSDTESDSQVLASWLSEGNRFARDPFWDTQATALHSAVITHIASTEGVEERNFAEARRLLMSDDTIYGLAKLLDTVGKKMKRMAYEDIGGFLQTTDVTRSGILSTATSYMKPFQSDQLTKALSNSTFDLDTIIRGEPVTIYMILPVDKLKSHRAILKMWVGTILKGFMSRKEIPQQRTLILLDECAQLETFPYLETIMTLCAGFGVQCWTFWQDLAQLQTCYPTSWQTILNNCSVLQTFGIRNRRMATQWGEYLDHGAEQLSTLDPESQILHLQGQGEFRCRRPDYLRDQVFANRFDTNPLYKKQVNVPVA